MQTLTKDGVQFEIGMTIYNSHGREYNTNQKDYKVKFDSHDNFYGLYYKSRLIGAVESFYSSLKALKQYELKRYIRLKEEMEVIIQQLQTDIELMG